MLTDRYLKGEYLSKVPDWHVGDAPWKASEVLLMLDKHGIVPRSVCDVGCGAGEILVEMQRKMNEGVRFVGYDISPQAMSICRPKENENLRFVEGDLAKADREAEIYDVLLVLDVFEHVPDYLGFLEPLRDRARWIVFHIPLDVSVESVLRRSKYMMHMREAYGHLHYFTRETALATLADTGYRVVDYFFTSDLSPGSLSGKPEGLRAMPWILVRFMWLMMGMLAYRLNPGIGARLYKGSSLLVLAERQA